MKKKKKTILSRSIDTVFEGYESLDSDLSHTIHTIELEKCNQWRHPRFLKVQMTVLVKMQCASALIQLR